MRTKYFEQFAPEKQKIRDQFKNIINRLAIMRNSNNALEFLKLCGIELPPKVKTVIEIPVDPEFIKSVLPKHKLLGNGDLSSE